MSATGYSPRRAYHHDKLVSQYVNLLRRRGYGAVELPVDGHRPDIRLHDGRGDYIDIKTTQNGNMNLAIEVNSLHAYWAIQRQEGRRVYIAHHIEDVGMFVLLPEAIEILRGPKRPSNGDNSNDDWHLCRPGNERGTPFDDFFHPLPGFEHDPSLF